MLLRATRKLYYIVRKIHCFKIYWLLAAIRIILVVIPQTGYIHPDEYFQSIEVLAGQSFNIDINKPWEFNSTFPVRSIAVPYMTVTTSFSILKAVHFFLGGVFSTKFVTPYFMLVFPRMFFCLLSFSVDFSLYKICRNNNEKYKARLVILASSYVMVVYGTRTFSNTMELILFSLLLYYVSESLTFTNTVVKKREYLNLRHKEAKTLSDKAKLHKLRVYLKSDVYRNCLQVSTITVLGFFNRPTFLAFAVAPVFFWLYRGIGYKSVISLNFHLRIIAFIVCCVPTIVFCIIVDSFFYGYISWGEIGMLDVSINSFVFTPLNFIKYNSKVENLAQHGLHPKYFHIFVNIPILFNILGVIGILGFGQMLYRLCKCQYHMLPTVRSIKGLMTLSVCIPVTVLSYFPHQEARFLLPILIPLIYLYSSFIFDEKDSRVQLHKNISPKTATKILPEDQKYLMKLWLCVNVLCVIFLGFVHQGGIFPVVARLSDEVRSNPHQHYHIVTSFIYTVPHSFFLQPKRDELKRVILHEEGSNSLALVFDKIRSIFDANGNVKVYLVVPRSLRDYLMFVNVNGGPNRLVPKLTGSFYPHLSTEVLHDAKPFASCTSEGSVFDCVAGIVSVFQLDLYEIVLGK